MRWWAILLILLALPLRAQDTGERVVAALSQNNVAINATFVGSEILVFGAIRREAPVPPDELGVIVTIQGPSGPLTVHRRERVAGIWVNTDWLEVHEAPSFYAVATTAPLESILTEEEDQQHAISVPRAIRASGTAAEDVPAFTEALIRIRADQGLYQQLDGAVSVDHDTLFRTRITLPSNLTEGTYLTRIFLMRGGEVIDVEEAAIHVQKVGLERLLFVMAHDRPLLYGLLALVVAVAAGWGASALFRFARG